MGVGSHQSLLTEIEPALVDVPPGGRQHACPTMLGALRLRDRIHRGRSQCDDVGEVATEAGGLLAVRQRRRMPASAQVFLPALDQRLEQPRDQPLPPAVTPHVAGDRQVVRLVQPSGGEGNFTLSDVKDQHGAFSPHDSHDLPP